MRAEQCFSIRFYKRSKNSQIGVWLWQGLTELTEEGFGVQTFSHFRKPEQTKHKRSRYLA